MGLKDGSEKWKREVNRTIYGNSADGSVRKPRGERRRSWSKYDSSTDHDTGLAQTNYYEGYVGETIQQRKVHIAINENGEVIYVRDMDGTTLYDRKHGIGTLPPDLNWSR